jgi:hypothetical protein
MLRKQQNKRGLRSKIKDYMEDVSIDIFGYEKKVAENLSNYLDRLSRENNIPPSSISIRISKPNQGVEAHVYYFDSHLRQVYFKELVDFFMNEGTGVIFNMEAKIRQKVATYFREYSIEKNLAIHALNVRISKPSDKILAVVYSQSECVESIPLKELIKYFKG